METCCIERNEGAREERHIGRCWMLQEGRHQRAVSGYLLWSTMRMAALRDVKRDWWLKASHKPMESTAKRRLHQLQNWIRSEFSCPLQPTWIGLYNSQMWRMLLWIVSWRKKFIWHDLPVSRGTFEVEKVGRLKKSPYGLKQSPRAWFDRFSKPVRSHGYSQSQADHTLFCNHSRDGKLANLIVYVDDIILTGDNLVELERLKNFLAREFEIKDLGTLRHFLGMEVISSKEDISVSRGSIQ